MKYFGITIGPIFENISEASKPATLWFASTLFSDFSYRLCKAIHAEWGNARIYSPCFLEDEDLSDGVGKYHDRIFFSVEDDNAPDKLDLIIMKVKDDTFDSAFCEEQEETARNHKKNSLSQSLYAKYVVLDELPNGKNILNTIGPMLDCMELMPSFSAVDSNTPLKELLNSADPNSMIRNSRLFMAVKPEKSQLITNGTDHSVRTITEIASSGDGGEALQRKHYYAVVSADGDRVGKIISSLTEESIPRFSEALLSYDREAAQKIKDFGGMTIYAGGDDLLFLAPVAGKNGENILELCSELGEAFRSMLGTIVPEEVSKGDGGPDVSFGIAVRYEKYPLFEALKASRELLGEIKSGTGRGLILTDIQKHSGQSEAFRIPNGFSGELIRFLSRYTAENEKEEKSSAADKGALNSVGYAIGTFRALIKQLVSLELPESEFADRMTENLFDNTDQKKYMEYLKELFRFSYRNILENANFRSYCGAWDDKKTVDFCDSVAALTKFQSFLRNPESNEESGIE